MHMHADLRTYCFDSHVVSLHTHHVFFTLPFTDTHMGWLAWYSLRDTVLLSQHGCRFVSPRPAFLPIWTRSVMGYCILWHFFSLMFVHEFPNVFSDGPTSLHSAATVQILLTWSLWCPYWGLVEPWRAAAQWGAFRIFRTSLKEASARGPFLFLLLLCLMMQSVLCTMHV